METPKTQPAASRPTCQATEQPLAPDVLWLCQVTGVPVALTECLECARHRMRRECQFDGTVLRALANSLALDETLLELRKLAEAAGVMLFRATSLLGCARQAWYELQCGRPLEKPSDHWARLRGVIIHAAMESVAGGDGVLSEIRLHVSLEQLGVKAWVSGRVDHYDALTRRLVDFKTINGYGKKMASMDLPKRQHVAQLWIYAWLLEQNGYAAPVEGRVIYIDMATVFATDVTMPSDHGQTREYVVAKARAISEAGPDGPAGDARAEWECRFCAFAERCAHRIVKNGNGSVHPSGAGVAT
jgi:CRISPR/Cas system-associated exonuclease Cas4 (RecB family)